MKKDVEPAGPAYRREARLTLIGDVLRKKEEMKWYEPYNLSIPLAIIIACIVVGGIQGWQRTSQIIATHPEQIKDSEQLRAQLQSRFIGGNLIIGSPFALVLFFTLMPLNRKHYRQKSQNKVQEDTARKLADPQH